MQFQDTIRIFRLFSVSRQFKSLPAHIGGYEYDSNGIPKPKLEIVSRTAKKIYDTCGESRRDTPGWGVWSATNLKFIFATRIRI